jgi:hypothetical protein
MKRTFILLPSFAGEVSASYADGGVMSRGPGILCDS